MAMSDQPLQILADLPVAPVLTELLGDKVELIAWDRASNDPKSIAGILTYGHVMVDGPLLDQLSSVRVISNYGVGVDHIDLASAKQRQIPVGNTPCILDGATADMAMTLLLAAGRRLMEGDRYARSPQFTRFDPGYMLGREIHGQTLGIFGMGRIGYQIARRARGFDMPVIYHNRTRQEEAEQSLPARYVSADELLAQADYVVLSVPLTDETRGLIGADELAKMKPTSILVNVARGQVVDTDALTAALAEKQIYAAGLDVTEPEPLPRDHPLLALDNVTIAPHLGSATEQTRRRMAEMTVENLLAGLDGEPLSHRVA